MERWRHSNSVSVHFAHLLAARVQLQFPIVPAANLPPHDVVEFCERCLGYFPAVAGQRFSGRRID
jgi:hypothetical protein